MPSSSAEPGPPAAPSPGASPAVAVRVLVPSLLRSYTGGAARLDVAAAPGPGPATTTLAAVLAAVDGRCPGFRFRIVDEQGALRPHIRIFVGLDDVRDLATPVAAGTEVMIVGALSGG